MSLSRGIAAVLAPLLLALPNSGYPPTPICDGSPRSTPIGAAQFRSLLDSVATGWNSGRPATSARCFTENAVYLEPPDRQRYQGRPAILQFFAASVQPPRADRMRWHVVAFDSVRQAGFGEYTYRGSRNYHGVAVVQLEGGLIRSWREYQYGSPLEWDAFVGPTQ